MLFHLLYFLKLEKLNEGPGHTREHLSLWRQPFQDRQIGVRVGRSLVFDSGEFIMSVMMSLTAVKGSGYISSHVHRAYSDRSMCRQKKNNKKKPSDIFQTLLPTESDKMHQISKM